MFKKILTIVILGAIGTVAYPQLQPLLDQYLLNGLAINPAYAGSQEALNVGLYARNQWIGFEGAPKTFTFTLHTPMRDKRVGLGMIVLNDKIGSRSETGFIFNMSTLKQDILNNLGYLGLSVIVFGLLLYWSFNIFKKAFPLFAL